MVIKIRQWQAHLLGIFLLLVIFLLDQGIYLINSETATGRVCQVSDKRGYRKYGRSEHFYICFTPAGQEEVKVYAGSNLSYSTDDTVEMIFKINNPRKARINTFQGFWLSHAVYYLIPFGILLAIITGIFYRSRFLVIDLSARTIKMSN